MGIAPSNLAILSACLKEQGIETRLFDCTHYKPQNKQSQDEIRTKLGHVKKTNFEDYVVSKTSDIYQDFIKVIEEYKPSLIAVTLIDSTISFTCSFLKKIKDKNIPVVAGGVASTFLYKKILNTGLIDFVCVGEGEKMLVDLCIVLKNGDNPKNVSNICIKDGINFIKNPMGKLVELDSLPVPDFSIYDYTRFYRPFRGRVVRMLQVDIDRGCPFTCSYCAAPALRTNFNENSCGSYYRVKNIDKSFDEIKTLINKYDINCLWISSETLLVIPFQKFKNFAERYKKEISLPFWCQSRLDTFSDEKLQLLKEMGCEAMSVGLEHGSERIRKELLNKRITNETILKAFNDISKYNITVTVNNMVGLPDETRENIFETIELNREIKRILGSNYSINVFTFIPFSGTGLRELCIKKGYINENTDIPISFFDESMLTMPSLSKADIKGLEKTFALYVSSDKSLWPKIKEAESNENIFNELINK